MSFETKGLKSRRKVRIVSLMIDLKDLLGKFNLLVTVSIGPVCLEVFGERNAFTWHSETITFRGSLWVPHASRLANTECS